MSIYETELPGVGRKFELELDDGARVVVVVHHDGRREVFRRASPEADSERLLDLGATDARQFAAMLQGTGFETVDVSALEVPLDEAIIGWIEVPPESDLVGRTLGAARISAETGVSIVAVQRGEETIPGPDAGFEVAAGDVLVGLGTREEHDALEALV